MLHPVPPGDVPLHGGFVGVEHHPVAAITDGVGVDLVAAADSVLHVGGEGVGFLAQQPDVAGLIGIAEQERCAAAAERPVDVVLD